MQLHLHSLSASVHIHLLQCYVLISRRVISLDQKAVQKNGQTYSYTALKDFWDTE